MKQLPLRRFIRIFCDNSSLLLVGFAFFITMINVKSGKTCNNLSQLVVEQEAVTDVTGRPAAPRRLLPASHVMDRVVIFISFKKG